MSQHIYSYQNYLVHTEDAKEILGYRCHKAFTRYIRRFDTILSPVYYTEDISDYNYFLLPGLPLEYNDFPDDTTSHCRAVSIISKSLPDSIFIPSAEYKPVTQKEMLAEAQKLMMSK